MRHRHVCLSAFSAETGRQLHDYYIIRLSFYQWLFPKNSHYFRKSPKQCFYGAVAHQAVNQFYLSILLFLSRIQSFIVNIGAKSRDIFHARRYVAVCRDKQPADALSVWFHLRRLFPQARFFRRVLFWMIYGRESAHRNSGSGNRHHETLFPVRLVLLRARKQPWQNPSKKQPAGFRLLGSSKFRNKFLSMHINSR